MKSSRELPAPEEFTEHRRVRRRWSPSRAVAFHVFARQPVQVVIAVFAVLIMLLSSADLAHLHAPRNAANPALQPVDSPPPPPYLPYVVAPSQFPAPDTILGTLGNISDPQLTVSTDQNQTIFEVSYLQYTPNGSEYSVLYTTGRYDPTEAVCQVSPVNCTNTSSRPNQNLPIVWSTPTSLVHPTSTPPGSPPKIAIGSSGGTISVAVSSGNETTVATASDYGVNTGWSNVTPTPVPGGSPKLAVTPCRILLTTLKSNAVTATTFNLPCGLPQTPPPPLGGGEHQLLAGSGPAPFVSAVSPDTGQVGTPVQIHGGNFADGETVHFGATLAWSIDVLSPGLTEAVAPPGSGVVNVTVTVGFQTSNQTANDLFYYNPGNPPPGVESVIPSTALPNAFINVTGANFNLKALAYFGGHPALQVVYISPTDLEVQVPWGVGKVDIQVRNTTSGLLSTVNPGDVFSFAVTAAVLPPARSASPVLTPSPTSSGGTSEGIVATEDANSSVAYYRSINGGISFTDWLIGDYSTSTGSPLLNSLGSTRVFLGGGVPAETAALNVGSLVFSLYTTQLENRTVVETSASTDGGEAWSGPYPSAPLVGTLADPALSASPNGYIYATWLENSNDTWELDQAVFAESGQLLDGPAPIPGTNSGSTRLLAAPAVAVDGWARPLYLWEAINATTNATELRITGAFPGPSTVLGDLATAFTQTAAQPWDFTVAGTELTDFVGAVDANISSVQASLSSGDLCTIQSRVVSLLGPELSTLVPSSVESGAPDYCGVSVPAPTTKIVNTTGPGSPNTYLGVYAAWLAEAVGYGKLNEPFWPGAPGNPDANKTAPYNPGSPYYAPGLFTNMTGSYYTFAVDPVTVNPNVLWLNVSGVAFGRHVVVNDTSCEKVGEGSTGSILTTDDDNASTQWATVTVVEPSQAYSYLLHGFWVSSFLTDLAPGTEGTWTMTVHTNYSETQTIQSTCVGHSGSNTTGIGFTSGMPSEFSATLSGNFTTVEETVPQGLVVHVLGNHTINGSAFDYVAWNNSVVGWANTTVRGSTYTAYMVDHKNVTAENTGSFSIPVGATYTAWANLTSEDGGTNTSWSNQFDTGFNGGVSSAAQTGSSSCSFTQSANPIDITWQGSTRIQEVTTSSAMLTWFSNLPGTGWATYNATSGGVYTQTAQMVNETGNPVLVGYPYQYQVQLTGLSPWNLYRVTVGVSAFSGCLEFDNGVPWSVQVHSYVQPQEMDYPYDSVTEEGGGARLTWTIPTEFALAATFLNGSVNYCAWVSDACANNTTIPLTGLSPLAGGSQYVFYWVNDTFQVNLTALAPNATYNVSILLNYTLNNGPFVATGQPFHFQYERDTSGDGLSDWEKIRGWNVTWQKDGTFYSTTETANPQLYATNGITGDFIEKEYGLNPNALSTTNDGMLDAWNLTFDLGVVGGAGTPALPASGFDYWYENTSYNFTDACPDPEMGPTCSFAPRVVNASNLTATGPNNPGGDNSPWGAEVLWSGVGSGSALSQLQGLMASEDGGARLRGVTGFYVYDNQIHRTLTVWGKLSWGADPLAFSTTHYKSPAGTEIPDGSMIDPLGYADVNVTINSWSMSGLTGGTGLHQGEGDGVAAFIRLSSNATGYFPSGRVDYSSYSMNSSSPGKGDSCPADCASPFTVVVNVPVESDEQFAMLNFSMVAKNSTDYIWDNTSSVSVDLGNSSAHTVRLWGTDLAQTYTLNVTYQVAPVFSKATTILLVPGDNSTLGGLPLGLQRYTGEQNFILLEVNDTVAGTGDTLTSTTIPYVNSTAVNGISSVTYTVGLAAGLNNLLVPRSLFKDSPLGEALLNMTFQNVTGHDFQGSLNGTFEPGYWIARDTGTAFDGLNYSLNNSPGGDNDPSGYIKVYSNRNQNCTQGAECGGVPSNTAIEATVPSYAIGAIFALNVSTTADLNDLLAGLVLNESGNFTNWAFAATPYLPSLGLSAEVTSALANPVFFNSGGYGAPTYTPPPPSPPAWQQFGSAVWNAVSGIPLVGALISAAWNWVAAAASYVAYLVDKAATWGLWAITHPETVLKEIAGAIVWALDQVLTAIIEAVEAIIQPITDEVNATMSEYALGLWSSLHSLWHDYNSSTSPTPAEAAAFVDEMFSTPVVIAFAFAAAVAIALVVVNALSVGAGFLENLVIGLLVSFAIGAAVAAVLSLVPASALSAAAVGAAWTMFNWSQSGLPLAPEGQGIHKLSSAVCPVFGAVQGGFREYESLKIGNDVQEGTELAAQVSKGAGAFTFVTVLPIVNAALGMVSLALDITALLVGGGEGQALSAIALVPGAVGLLYGGWALSRMTPAQKSLGLQDEVLVGELVSGSAVAMGAANLLSGC